MLELLLAPLNFTKWVTKGMLRWTGSACKRYATTATGWRAETSQQKKEIRLHKKRNPVHKKETTCIKKDVGLGKKINTLLLTVTKKEKKLAPRPHLPIYPHKKTEHVHLKHLPQRKTAT